MAYDDKTLLGLSKSILIAEREKIHRNFPTGPKPPWATKKLIQIAKDLGEAPSPRTRPTFA